MTWIKACKEFQKQRGEDAKYLIPKKGSVEYDKVKAIYDAMEKPPKKEPVKKVKKVKDDTVGAEIVQELVKKVVKKPKKTVKIQERDDEDDLFEIEPEIDETNIRTVIRNELIEHIKLHGIESL